MAFSSLYIGASGLIAQSDYMQVIGNNLANIDTVGYKKSQMVFNDLISEELACGLAEPNQIGMGVGLSTVQTSFLQGDFLDGDYATDMAITGNGFFGVVSDDNVIRYTRDGTFRFNNDGELVNTSGLNLQGYPIDPETGALGTLGNIVLPMRTVEVDGSDITTVISDPLATTLASTIVQLDKNATDQITDATDPFFALAKTWNGLNDDPLGGLTAGYSTSMKIYDDAGNAHEVTVTFDKVDSSTLSNASAGQTQWEFIITCDPSEDGRAGIAGTSAAGLMAMGTLTFGADGKISNQTLFQYTGGTDDVKDLGNWTLTSDFGSGGVPQFDMTFAGASGATGTVGEQTIAWDFGIGSSSSSWAGGSTTASGVGKWVNNLAQLADTQLDALASTSYDEGSYTVNDTQNGYAMGFLLNLSVDENGVLQGTFSNGQEEDLAQVALYRFNSEYGLRSEGNNLYSATLESGEARVGLAGEGGRGSIMGETLESSNVDMATEFANMIVSQRGFQSNTKVITTTDSLINTAVSMKK